MLFEVIFLAASAGLPSQRCAAADVLEVRNGHAMAYDRDSKVVVLFGGADERQVLSDPGQMPVPGRGFVGWIDCVPIARDLIAGTDSRDTVR